MPKFISDGKEGIEYLDNLSQKRLSSWAKGTLVEGKTLPILLSGHTEPDELLLNFGKDSILGRKIKNAVSGLVSAWDISEGTTYLSELLYLVGMLNITNVHSRIIDWIRRGNLKGLPGLAAHSFFKEDAHLGCWRSIGHYHSTHPALQELALRDIADDRYFLICYRILFEENIDHLIHFFPNFLRICLNGDDPLVTFNNEFHRINENFGPEFFKRFPEKILSKLEEREGQFFQDAISKVRYELKRN